MLLSIYAVFQNFVYHNKKKKKARCFRIWSAEYKSGIKKHMLYLSRQLYCCTYSDTKVLLLWKYKKDDKNLGGQAIQFTTHSAAQSRGLKTLLRGSSWFVLQICCIVDVIMKYLLMRGKGYICVQYLPAGWEVSGSVLSFFYHFFCFSEMMSNCWQFLNYLFIYFDPHSL